MPPLPFLLSGKSRINQPRGGLARRVVLTALPGWRCLSKPARRALCSSVLCCVHALLQSSSELSYNSCAHTSLLTSPLSYLSPILFYPLISNVPSGEKCNRKPSHLWYRYWVSDLEQHIRKGKPLKSAVFEGAATCWFFSHWIAPFILKIHLNTMREHKHKKTFCVLSMKYFKRNLQCVILYQG